MRANVKSTGARIEVELFKGRYYRVMDENKLDEKRSWSAEELTLDTTRPSPGEELEQLASKPPAPTVVGSDPFSLAIQQYFSEPHHGMATSEMLNCASTFWLAGYRENERSLNAAQRENELLVKRVNVTQQLAREKIEELELEIDRLKADVAARYTLAEVESWLDYVVKMAHEDHAPTISNLRRLVFKSDKLDALHVFIANQRKEKS